MTAAAEREAGFVLAAEAQAVLRYALAVIRDTMLTAEGCRACQRLRERAARRAVAS